MNRDTDAECGGYNPEEYERMHRTPPAYLAVPTCPTCASHACGPAESYPDDNDTVTDRDLLCAVCGLRFVGTLEQVQQARRAETAWNERTDNRRGPWLRVLKQRAKKDGPQLRLFGGGKP